MNFKKRSPHYILRFDDITPTMNWDVWNIIERELDKYSIKPLLAVVPDNKDSNLVYSPPSPNFWARVCEWQRKGYTIALHGFQHKYVNKSSGILKLSKNSEFAGLSKIIQTQKIASGLKIFRQNGVVAEAWIAPSHSFDRTTLIVLKEQGINVISDGLFRYPGKSLDGTIWVPQQLWNFKSKSNGVWTICFHHNDWSDIQTMDFINELNVYHQYITNLTSVLKYYSDRRLSVIDFIYSKIFWSWNFGNLLKFRKLYNSL